MTERREVDVQAGSTIRYAREDGAVYKIATRTTRVDVAALQAELEDLLAEKEPGDEELMEWGRMLHPYYQPDREMRIEALRTQIATLGAVK